MSRKPNLEARANILDSAQALIYKRGFKGVSMDDIADAAGLKKANLFHYYPTKEALGLAVFDKASAQGRSKVEENLGSCSNDPINAVERMFDQACSNMQQSGCSGGCFIGNIAQELSDTSETLRNKVADYMRQWADRWTEFLQRKKDEGFFRPEFDPNASASGLLSLFEGAMIFCKASRSTAPLQSAKQLARQHFESLRS
jgi:TetR/AcrR family transcriptional regulator, transcriptional repressor for nem operon